MSVDIVNLNFSQNQAPPKIVFQPRDDFISLSIYQDKSKAHYHTFVQGRIYSITRKRSKRRIYIFTGIIGIELE